MMSGLPEGYEMILRCTCARSGLEGELWAGVDGLGGWEPAVTVREGLLRTRDYFIEALRQRESGAS